jgi:hypothetical protein
MNIDFRLNPDDQTIGFSGNKMCLKISSKANNGLSFNNGKIVATKAPDGTPGSGGTMNTPGNALGPINSTETDSLAIVGFNSSVSRHQKYTGEDTFLKANDGPVMTKLEGDHLKPNASIAIYMIMHAGG